MDTSSVLENIARANFHRGGWRTLRLFDVDQAFLANLMNDTARLVTENVPSHVHTQNHVTHWTKPIGHPVQFSLLNATGDFADTTRDHDLQVTGKRFHHADRYPALAEFIRLLPGATNMRLNGMPPGAGLSPHEEHVVRRHGRTYLVRARFHLPLATNPGANVLLDNQWFHLSQGSVYFFNNGCVHSAMNLGDTQRYHLVWDMTLTRDVIERMFGEQSHGVLLRAPQRAAAVVREEQIREYATSGSGARWYRYFRASKIGVTPHTWQNGYQRIAFAAFKLFGRLEYDELR